MDMTLEKGMTGVGEREGGREGGRGEGGREGGKERDSEGEREEVVGDKGIFTTIFNCYRKGVYEDNINELYTSYDRKQTY